MQAIQMLDSIVNKVFLNKKIEFVIVFAFCLVLSLLILSKIDILDSSNPTFKNVGDHQKYLYMARKDPFGLYFAPFGWRIGLPLLVKLLPLDAEHGFLCITFLSVVGTGVLLYYILRKFIPYRYVCFTGILFYYGLGWAVFVNLYDFWLTDALAIFMLVLALHFILIKNDVGFLLTIFFGVFVKEIVLVAIPVYYTFNVDKLLDIKVLKRLALFTILCLVALLCIRWLIPGYSTDPAYLSGLPADLRQSSFDPINSYMVMLGLRVQQFSTLDATLNSIPVYLLDPFGVTLFVLSTIGACVRSDIFNKFLPFMATVFLLLLFGGDTGRYLVLMFPAIITMACYAMIWACERFAVRQYYFVVAAIIIILLHMKWYFSVPFQIEFTFVFLGLLVSVLFNRVALSSDSFLRLLLYDFFKQINGRLKKT